MQALLVDGGGVLACEFGFDGCDAPRDMIAASERVVSLDFPYGYGTLLLLTRVTTRLQSLDATHRRSQHLYSTSQDTPGAGPRTETRRDTRRKSQQDQAHVSRKR